ALRDAGVREIQFHVERATPWGSTLTHIAGGDGSALGVERVTLDYSPVDLWNRRIDAIRLSGGRIELEARGGIVDFSPLARFIAHSGEPVALNDADRAAPLPVTRIDVTDSALVLKTERQTVELPIDLTVLNAKTGEMIVDARVGPNKSMSLEGKVDRSAHTATWTGITSAGWTLQTIRTIWPNAQIGIDGTFQLSGSMKWDAANLSGTARVEIAKSPSSTQE